MSKRRLHFIVGREILVFAILSLRYRSVALGEETDPSTAQVRPRHVFIVVLENQSFETTFGRNSPAPYLSRQLAPKDLPLSRGRSNNCEPARRQALGLEGIHGRQGRKL